MRKKILIGSLAILLIAAGSAQATNYTPLVPLPGMPAGGAFDLSTYLIGFYNFLLSIVGIVAVLFMIFGGLKYITAVGNSSKISDAKDQILSAISGLLLALLSWVIVDTLNPDVLYMRQPGVAFNELNGGSSGGYCSTFVGGNCQCKDGESGNGASAAACDRYCISQGKCKDSSRETACIASGSPVDAAAPGYVATQGCSCADGSHLILPPGDEDGCSNLCRTAKRCGNKFLVIKFKMRAAPVGQQDQYGNDIYAVPEGEGQDYSLWHFALTNDASQYEHYRITGQGVTDAGAALSEENILTASAKDRANYYDCAILVTNEETAATDETYVFWVKEGGVINAGDGASMLTQLHNYISGPTSCCAEGNGANLSCAVDVGWHLQTECDQNMPSHVLATTWADNVQNSCVNCSFAEKDGEAVNFRPARSIKCMDGYWR